MANLEVEVRGFLDSEGYANTKSRLQDLGLTGTPDNRITTFFMVDGATLKVTNMVDLTSCKIAYKSGDIARSEFQNEIEIGIDPADFDSVVQMFQSLGFTDIQETKQQRINYEIDSCSLALKWSEDWGYHFEVDKVVSSQSDVASARAKIEQVCKKIGLNPLSDDDFAAFCVEIAEKHKSINLES
ncbi:MAG: CYTH domain-containing protein [Erythrobacter sp.]